MMSGTGFVTPPRRTYPRGQVCASDRTYPPGMTPCVAARAGSGPKRSQPVTITRVPVGTRL